MGGCLYIMYVLYDKSLIEAQGLYSFVSTFMGSNIGIHIGRGRIFKTLFVNFTDNFNLLHAGNVYFVYWLALCGVTLVD